MYYYNGPAASGRSIDTHISASDPAQLRVTVPAKLAGITEAQGLPHLVRPCCSAHPPSGPFDALLLIDLSHNEHARVASSILITARPLDRASVLRSKIRIFLSFR